MLKTIEEELKKAREKTSEIQTGVETLAEAEEKGLEITPQTTTQQAQQFITADTTAISKPPMYEPPPPQDTEGLQREIEAHRKELEEAHQRELDRIRTQLEEAQTREQEWRTKQEETMEKAEPLTSPFREDIEKSERERLKVEENFFQNQSLVNELDGLLTESIELTRRLQTQKVPGLAGMQQSGRMIRAQESVQARVSVINAVMAARNNQIGTALNFIDRTVSAITQDRQDRLTYLSTLFNWYETQRTEEGAKIFNLTADEKGIINKQIGLIEDDLARAQAVSDKIKEIMIANPDLAAESGISLDDTLEEITKKMADAIYTREVRSERDEMGEGGYSQITEEEMRLKPLEEVVTRTDSKGNTRYYWKPAPPKEPKEYAPTQYTKEWQEAGGEAGTGMTLADWIKQRTGIAGGGVGGVAEGNESDLAIDYVTEQLKGNPDITDEALFNDIKKDSGLSNTEINNAIKEGRRKIEEEKGGISIDEMSKSWAKTIEEAKNGGFERAVSEQQLTANMKENLGLKTADDLPKQYKTILKEIIFAIYGGTWGQKLMPGGLGGIKGATQEEIRKKYGL